MCAGYTYKWEGIYRYTQWKNATFPHLQKWNPRTQRQYTAMIMAFVAVNSNPARSRSKNLFPEVSIQ